MRNQPPAMRLKCLLIILLFACVSNGYRNGGEQALVMKLLHHDHTLHGRTASDSTATALDDHYPVAYDFHDLASTTSSAALYPVPASASDSQEFSTGHPVTTPDESATSLATKPRSLESSDVPEIESTSTAPVPESSNGALLPTVVPNTTFVSGISSISPSSSSTVLLVSTGGPVSQTSKDHSSAETVTVTVTNFISNTPSTNITPSVSSKPTYVISSSNTAINTSNSSTPSAGSSDSISVIIITSFHTITLSGEYPVSSTKETTITPSPSPAQEVSAYNSSSTITQPSSSTPAEVSVVVITKTETYTVSLNSTVSSGSTTSATFTTSTVEVPVLSSQVPPFPVLLNESTATAPVVSSLVNSAFTSIYTTSLLVITQTVFENVTVTLSQLTSSASRVSRVTHTAVPTPLGWGNTTESVASTEPIMTPYPVPNPGGSNTNAATTTNTTAAETPKWSTSTEVITITVYPIPLKITATENGTSVATVFRPYSLSNSSSSIFPTTGGILASGGGAHTTGSVDRWSTNLSNASVSSTVIGTARNSTTVWSRTATGQPVGTTCEQTHTPYQSGIATSLGTANSSTPATSGLNGTATYPIPTTLKTTFSRSSSVNNESSLLYPSPSAKNLPGSPSYPWGGSGPLHRLKDSSP